MDFSCKFFCDIESTHGRLEKTNRFAATPSVYAIALESKTFVDLKFHIKFDQERIF